MAFFQYQGLLVDAFVDGDAGFWRFHGRHRARSTFRSITTFVAGTYGPGFSGDCVILRAGGTACTGNTTNFRVPSDVSVVAIAITEYGHVCGLDESGVVTCWNSQQHPAWDGKALPLGRPATAIGAGDYNACALLADGTVKCWAIDGTFPDSLGGSVATSTGWPAVDLGTRPAP